MSDIPIPWKKITRGLPKGKKYADDRIPTIEEINIAYRVCYYNDIAADLDSSAILIAKPLLF